MCVVCAAFDPFRPSCPYGSETAQPPRAWTDQIAALQDVVVETTDAAGDSSTSHCIDEGEVFLGTLEGDLAADWIAVELSQGTTYTAAMMGIGALDASVNDTYLRLHDEAGVQVDYDDDGGPGRHSTLTFTAAETGTYYLSAESWYSSPGGDYAVSLVEGTRAVFNADMAAGALLRYDASWAAAPETATTVTWGIRAPSAARDAAGNSAPFVPLTEAQVAAATQAMASFSAVAGLTLVQVAPGSTTSDASMLIGGYNGPNDGAGAYAYLPGSRDASARSGDVWLDATAVSASTLTPGTYSYFVMLHEFGHAMGLAHPGDYNAAPGVAITYGNNAQYAQDSHQFTVMSYFDEGNTAANLQAYPETLMIHDIYALQQLYGANMATRAGDTTYGFNTTESDSVYDFARNARPFLAIWDGGGQDRLDVSGYAGDQRIDLQDGAFSDVMGDAQNVSIALGAVLEEAVAGGGHDHIIGNAAANTLIGGGGDDDIDGREGQDLLQGGSGNDTLKGGLGNDVLEGEAGQDVLYGDNGADVLSGALGDDSLYGGTGNDQLSGGAGRDHLDGQRGNDILTGGDDDDHLLGGAGGDVLRGDAGHDRLYGQAHNDALYGGSGADVLNGGSGEDRLFGGADADSLFGGSDSDRLFGEDGNDVLRGGAADDALFGGTGADMVRGNDGQDRLLGGSGNDRLWGGMGNDDLIGGGGRDVLGGGAGDDTLKGCFNGDRFVFDDDHGRDVILDFDATNPFEKIDFRTLGCMTSMDDVIDRASYSAAKGGVTIDTSSDSFLSDIFLQDVVLQDLDATDFLF